MKKAFLGILIGVMLLLVGPAAAQDTPSELRIVRTNTAALPSVDVTLFVQDEKGTPIDLSDQFISVKHNGVQVDNATLSGSDTIGTFTVFLLDLPPGVAGEIDSIKQSIQTFASDSFMQEQSDHVAVYRVDEINALEMQGPTFFHNDIINLFTLGIETESGPTALIDSIGDLITRMNSLRPDPNMATSIVVFSDGTDSISTQFSDTQLYGLARDNGVKLYTVLVENQDLIFSGDAGREFMETLANETGGGSVLLPDLTGTKILWDNIVSFRELPVVRYTPDVLEPGTATVEVSLPNFPSIPPASTSVSVPATLPQVSIDVAEEDRTLTVEELVSPVALSFPTSVTWLDEEPRTVEKAQLVVNGRPAIDVDPSTLSRIPAELQLNLGENTVQVVVVDNEGQTSKSPPLVLVVEQGATSIPRAIRGGSAIPWRIILYILVCLLIIGLLIYLFNRMRQSGGGRGQSMGGWRKRMSIARAERKQARSKPSTRSSASSSRNASQRGPEVRTAAPRSAPAKPTGASYAPVTAGPSMQPTIPTGTPKIEVLDARSSISTLVPVNRSEFLIGRSPTVDLALTDDATVSRIHATIVEDNGTYRIYDEQSTSGTYVNDREVPEYGLQLTSGDEIHIGAVHLRFQF